MNLILILSCAVLCLTCLGQAVPRRPKGAAGAPVGRNSGTMADAIAVPAAPVAEKAGAKDNTAGRNTGVTADAVAAAAEPVAAKADETANIGMREKEEVLAQPAEQFAEVSVDSAGPAATISHLFSSLVELVKGMTEELFSLSLQNSASALAQAQDVFAAQVAEFGAMFPQILTADDKEFQQILDTAAESFKTAFTVSRTKFKEASATPSGAQNFLNAFKAFGQIFSNALQALRLNSNNQITEDATTAD